MRQTTCKTKQQVSKSTKKTATFRLEKRRTYAFNIRQNLHPEEIPYFHQSREELLIVNARQLRVEVQHPGVHKLRDVRREGCHSF